MTIGHPGNYTASTDVTVQNTSLVASRLGQFAKCRLAAGRETWMLKAEFLLDSSHITRDFRPEKYCQSKVQGVDTDD